MADSQKKEDAKDTPQAQPPAKRVVGVMFDDGAAFLGGKALTFHEPPVGFGQVQVDFDPTGEAPAAPVAPTGPGPYDHVKVRDEPDLGRTPRPVNKLDQPPDGPEQLIPASQLYPQPPPAARHTRPARPILAPTDPLLEHFVFGNPRAAKGEPQPPVLGEDLNSPSPDGDLICTDVFSGPMAGNIDEETTIPPAGISGAWQEVTAPPVWQIVGGPKRRSGPAHPRRKRT